MSKPKLIVFDLDYTLWPYWCDTHIQAPFKMSSNGKVYDSCKQHVKTFPEVPDVLKKLKDDGYLLGVASRTSEIKGAKQLISLFGWQKYFTYIEIYPGRKTTHFNKIKQDSGLDYSEMLFFDDEIRNKYDVEKIGVLMILINDTYGVTHKAIEEGLQEFAKRAAF